MISLTRLLPVLVCSFVLSVITAAHSAQYTIDGLVLGEKVKGPNLQSYSCKPSDEFARHTTCARTQTRSRGYNYSAFSTIMYKEDGTFTYLMIKVAPVVITKQDIQKELDELSREHGEQPATIEWQEANRQAPISVIATWGDIKFEKIDYNTREIVEAGKNPRIGILTDAFGDIRRSAREGLQVYRIAGGTGYVYSATVEKNGRGHRQYIAADGSELAVRQYEVALSAILQRDQSLAADDFHLWPQVADITRRLARGTSPTIANETMDRVFEKFRSKKLRSHVWSILPGGAIGHLAAREHSYLDIYGPETEHPEIRRNIQAFLAGNPTDPFCRIVVVRDRRFRQSA